MLILSNMDLNKNKKMWDNSKIYFHKDFTDLRMICRERPIIEENLKMSFILIRWDELIVS